MRGVSDYERGCGYVTNANSSYSAIGELTIMCRVQALDATTAGRLAEYDTWRRELHVMPRTELQQGSLYSWIPTGCTEATLDTTPASPALYSVRLSAKLQRPQQLRQTLHCLEGSGQQFVQPSYQPISSVISTTSSPHRPPSVEAPASASSVAPG